MTLCVANCSGQDSLQCFTREELEFAVAVRRSLETDLAASRGVVRAQEDVIRGQRSVIDGLQQEIDLGAQIADSWQEEAALWEKKSRSNSAENWVWRAAAVVAIVLAATK